MPSLMIGGLAAKFASEIRAQPDGSIERLKVAADPASFGPIQPVGIRHEERVYAHIGVELTGRRLAGNGKGKLVSRRSPRQRSSARTHRLEVQ